jgi:hypothetical protein
MRTLLFLLLVGCAHDKNAQPQTNPQPTALDQVQLRACESCRHDLELCNKRATTLQASGVSPCMDDFMKCLDGQQLDSTRCAGLN